MAKKEIHVCDVCDKNLATGTCFFCYKDICGNCSEVIELKITGRYRDSDIREIGKIYCCKECEDKAKIELKRKSENIDNFANLIMDFFNDKLKKTLILENLEDDTHK